MYMLRVVGFGPFPLPGERRRWARAEREARRLLKLAGEASVVQEHGEDTG
jgi:hypothetical protein